MNHQTIQFENRGGIGIITLNRPERLNAINRQMIDEFLNCFDGLI